MRLTTKTKYVVCEVKSQVDEMKVQMNSTDFIVQFERAKFLFLATDLAVMSLTLEETTKMLHERYRNCCTDDNDEHLVTG